MKPIRIRTRRYQARLETLHEVNDAANSPSKRSNVPDTPVGASSMTIQEEINIINQDGCSGPQQSQQAQEDHQTQQQYKPSYSSSTNLNPTSTQFQTTNNSLSHSVTDNVNSSSMNLPLISGTSIAGGSANCPIGPGPKTKSLSYLLGGNSKQQSQSQIQLPSINASGTIKGQGYQGHGASNKIQQNLNSCINLNYQQQGGLGTDGTQSQASDSEESNYGNNIGAQYNHDSFGQAQYGDLSSSISGTEYQSWQQSYQSDNHSQSLQQQGPGLQSHLSQQKKGPSGQVIKGSSLVQSRRSKSNPSLTQLNKMLSEGDSAISVVNYCTQDLWGKGIQLATGPQHISGSTNSSANHAAANVQTRNKNLNLNGNTSVTSLSIKRNANGQFDSSSIYRSDLNSTNGNTSSTPLNQTKFTTNNTSSTIYSQSTSSTGAQSASSSSSFSSSSDEEASLIIEDRFALPAGGLSKKASIQQQNSQTKNQNQSIQNLLQQDSQSQQSLIDTVMIDQGIIMPNSNDNSIQGHNYQTNFLTNNTIRSPIGPDNCGYINDTDGQFIQNLNHSPGQGQDGTILQNNFQNQTGGSGLEPQTSSPDGYQKQLDLFQQQLLGRGGPGSVTNQCDLKNRLDGIQSMTMPSQQLQQCPGTPGTPNTPTSPTAHRRSSPSNTNILNQNSPLSMSLKSPIKSPIAQLHLQLSNINSNKPQSRQKSANQNLNSIISGLNNKSGNAAANHNQNHNSAFNFESHLIKNQVNMDQPGWSETLALKNTWVSMSVSTPMGGPGGQSNNDIEQLLHRPGSNSITRVSSAGQKPDSAGSSNIAQSPIGTTVGPNSTQSQNNLQKSHSDSSIIGNLGQQTNPNSDVPDLSGILISKSQDGKMKSISTDNHNVKNQAQVQVTKYQTQSVNQSQKGTSSFLSAKTKRLTNINHNSNLSNSDSVDLTSSLTIAGTGNLPQVPHEAGQSEENINLSQALTQQQSFNSLSQKSTPNDDNSNVNLSDCESSSDSKLASITVAGSSSSKNSNSNMHWSPIDRMLQNKKSQQHLQQNNLNNLQQNHNAPGSNSPLSVISEDSTALMSMSLPLTSVVKVIASTQTDISGEIVAAANNTVTTSTTTQSRKDRIAEKSANNAANNNNNNNSNQNNLYDGSTGLKSALKKSKTEIDTLKKSITSLEEKLKETESTRNNLEKEKDVLDQEKQSLIESHEKRIKDDQKLHEESESQYREQASIQQTTINTLKSMLRDTLAEKNKIEVQHNSVIRQSENLEREKQDLLRERDGLMIRLETEQAQLMNRLESVQRKMSSRGGPGGHSNSNMNSPLKSNMNSPLKSPSKVTAGHSAMNSPLKSPLKSPSKGVNSLNSLSNINNIANSLGSPVKTKNNSEGLGGIG